jgi:hypothetical protein
MLVEICFLFICSVLIMNCIIVNWRGWYRACGVGCVFWGFSDEKNTLGEKGNNFTLWGESVLCCLLEFHQILKMAKNQLNVFGLKLVC